MNLAGANLKDNEVKKREENPRAPVFKQGKKAGRLVNSSTGKPSITHRMLVATVEIRV